MSRTLGGVHAFRKARGVLPGQCTWCREPVPKGRQTWCRKAECLHEYQIRNDPGYARGATFERDRGVCRGCGLDTEAVRLDLERLRLIAKTACEVARYRIEMVDGVFGPWERRVPMPTTQEDRDARDHALTAYSIAREQAGIPVGQGGTSYLTVLHPAGHLWEMDHIVEVVRGGGGCGLSNLQTLCRACHRAKTARLAAERAVERRAGRGESTQPALFAPPIAPADGGG